MIRFQCPHCGRFINGSDEHAGKRAPCPGCKKPLVIPQPNAVQPARPPRDPVEETVTESPRPRPAAGSKGAPSAKPGGPSRARATPPRRSSRPDEEGDVEIVEDDEVVDVEVIEDDEDERPRRKHREDVADEDRSEVEERPRRRRKRRRTGPYATCPHCGERGDAYRVGYTLWGGFIGPWLFTHVRCNSCGTAYNGKTGDYNTTAIVLWVVIPLAIGIVVGLVTLVVELTSK